MRGCTAVNGDAQAAAVLYQPESGLMADTKKTNPFPV